MSLFAVDKDPSDNKLREFGWAMVGGFLVVGGLIWVLPALDGWWRSEPDAWNRLGWVGSSRQWLAVGMWALGLVLFVLAHAPKPVARGTYVVWMSLVMPLGVIMSTLMLTVLFVVLLPVFALIRFADPMRKKLKPGAGQSYWEDSKLYPATLERMRRPF